LAAGDLIFISSLPDLLTTGHEQNELCPTSSRRIRCNKEYRASALLGLDQFNISHFAKNQDRPKAVSLHAIGFAFDQAAPVAAGRWRR
jgi:hypothetical protein